MPDLEPITREEKLLDGVNNVFASTGDVEELKYFSKEAE